MPSDDETPEREQTDESLRVERPKAAAHFGEKQAAVDESADAIIEKARAQTKYSRQPAQSPMANSAFRVSALGLTVRFSRGTLSWKLSATI